MYLRLLNSHYYLNKNYSTFVSRVVVEHFSISSLFQRFSPAGSVFCCFVLIYTIQELHLLTKQAPKWKGWLTLSNLPLCYGQSFYWSPKNICEEDIIIMEMVKMIVLNNNQWAISKGNWVLSLQLWFFYCLVLIVCWSYDGSTLITALFIVRLFTCNIINDYCKKSKSWWNVWYSEK